jgi:hypothetical protein
MSWNFPFNSQEWREFVTQCLNFLKTEVEQLKKQQPSTPENLLGVPIGGPLTADMVDLPFEPDPPGDEDGGGDGGRVVFLAKTLAASDKSATTPVLVQPWRKNASGSGHTQDSAEPSVEAYPILGGVAANKFCIIAKDLKTGGFYIASCECT